MNKDILFNKFSCLETKEIILKKIVGIVDLTIYSILKSEYDKKLKK